MSTIRSVRAREVLDSRGDPTVEVEMHCDSSAGKGDAVGTAIVPAGASTGQAEAKELRDGDPRRYSGRGVLRAVAHVNDVIGPAVLGMDSADQAAVDACLIELDGTEDKSRLGANAILGISLAAAHAAAASRRVPLYVHIHALWNALLSRGDTASNTLAATAPRMPLVMTNIISGGLHAGGNLNFQDFLLVPVGAPSYSVGLEWIDRALRQLARILAADGYEARLVADEGGFGPRLSSDRAAAEYIVRAASDAGLRPGADFALALDVAASHFFDGSNYRLSATGDQSLTRGQMIDYLDRLAGEFPIYSIEDGLAENDWDGWCELTARLGSRVRLVGDDLFATNPRRIEQGIALGAANAVLIKVNQIGTLSETLDAMRIAHSAGYARVVSARSGETEDSTIADLAVGTASEMIKIGSLRRSERLAKYNRLLRIDEELSRG